MSDPFSPRSSRPRHWWVTEKLILEFPDVPPSEVLAAVLDAFRAAERFGLSHAAEAVIAEQVATEQLAQRTVRESADRHDDPDEQSGTV